MKAILHTITVVLLVTVAANGICAEENDSFSTDKILSDLNSKIELSKEQWEKLKPVLGEKSETLKKSINEYVDKGYVQMEDMSEKLKGVSEETEKKFEGFLNSEEIQKLKNYLSELDEEAIRQTRDKMIAELAAVLALTEEQVSKLKPVLEDSISQMSEMIEELVRKGESGWTEFKKQYKTLTDNLRKKLDGTLDEEQMERFEEYKNKKQNDIEMALAEA